MRRKAVAALSLMLLLVAVSGGAYLYLVHAASAAGGDGGGHGGDAGDGVLIKIEEGMTARSVGHLLKEKLLIRDENVFYAAARYRFLGRMVHCVPLALEKGTYKVSPSMSMADIFALLSSGKTQTRRVTIPEGLTISKTAARLEAAGVCSASDFVSVCRDSNAATSRGLYGTSLEGYLFPDTYFFDMQMTAAQVADTMVGNFVEHIKTTAGASASGAGAEGECRLQEAVGCPVGVYRNEDFYRVLIVASIVEREYREAEEAPLIASVFFNRIKDGMGLYSCATVEYIITEIEGRPHPDVIKYEDLKSDSPYNTYKWAALPPTPISNPGMVSINAAINPAVTDYYYFRLADAGHGTHVFSKTFDGHIKEGVVYRTKNSG